MISIVGQTVVDKYVTYKYVGLSTDEKPTAPNGSKFKEMDTGDEYFFDGDEQGWTKRENAYLASIEITTAPNKVSYIVGEQFDPTGMVVTATFTDGFTDTYYDDEVTIVAPSVLTKTDTSVTVSLTLNGRTRTAEQAITVLEIELASIAFTSEPSVRVEQTEQGKRYYINLDTAAITATYTNGDERDVTSSCTFDPVDGTQIPMLGETIITATYTEDSVTKTATTYVEPAPR